MSDYEMAKDILQMKMDLQIVRQQQEQMMHAFAEIIDSLKKSSEVTKR